MKHTLVAVLMAIADPSSLISEEQLHLKLLTVREVSWQRGITVVKTVIEERTDTAVPDGAEKISEESRQTGTTKVRRGQHQQLGICFTGGKPRPCMKDVWDDVPIYVNGHRQPRFSDQQVIIPP